MCRPFFVSQMPYQIKKQGKKTCVCDESGKPIEGGCHSSRPEAMRHMRALYANVPDAKKMEGIQLALAMKNPVWLGCAVTNRPHIRLKEYPLSVVDIQGKQFVRVPMMRTGKYSHPQGDLDMSGPILDQFILNHQKSLADFEVVLDAKHQPDRGAWGLFEAKHGGFVQREKADTPQVADPNGELLVAYGVPTGDDVVEAIQKGKFLHASMEFHPDYRSNVQQTYLSTMDLREIEMTENIELGGPGSGRKGHMSGAFKKGLRNATAGPRAGNRLFKKWKKKTGKNVSTIGKTGKKAVGAYIGGVNKARKAYTNTAKRAWGKTRRFEADTQVIQLNSSTTLLPTYEVLSDFVDDNRPDEFAFFDASVFDFSEFDLPMEGDFYKVDAQTAEEMLAVLDELAQDEQFAHLFDEDSLESEDESMADVEDVVDATELQVRLEAAEAQNKAASQRILALEKQAAEAEIRAVISEANTYVDENGMGHSAVLLNLVQDLMLGNPIGEGDGAIQLEDAADAGKIAQYFRRGLARLLKTAPGQVKLEGRTIPAAGVQLEHQNGNGLYDQGKADAKNFWGRVF